MTAALTAMRRIAQLTGAAIGTIGTASVLVGLRFNQSMERSLTSFRLFLGGQREAIGFYDELFEINKRTPFETAGINAAAQRLLGFKFTGEETLEIIRTLGDAISGIGATEADVNELAIAFGKIRAQTRLTRENLEAFTVRGIDVFGILAEELGVSNEELFKQITAGALEAERFIPVILAGIQRDFEGAAEEQSKTFAGQLSTIKDVAAQTLGVITVPLFGRLRDVVLPALGSLLERMQAAAAGGGGDIGLLIGATGGASAAIDVVVGKLDELAGGTGVVTEAFETGRDAAREVWQFLTGSLLPALGTLTGTLFGVLNPLGLVRSVFGFINDHQRAARIIIIALVAAWATYNAVTLIGIARNAVLNRQLLLANARLKLNNFLVGVAAVRRGVIAIATGAVVIATAAWTVAQWLLNAALLANPIVLLIAAIVAVIAGAVYLIIRYWDTIVAAFRRAGDWIVGIVGSAIDWIRDNWKLLLAILLGPLGLAVFFIAKHWDEISDAFGTAVDWIGERLDGLVSWFADLPGRIASAVSGLWDGIQDEFTGVINWIIRRWNDVVDSFSFLDFIPGIDLGGAAITEIGVAGTVLGAAPSPDLAATRVGLPDPGVVEPLGGELLGAERETIVQTVVNLDGREIAEAVGSRVERDRARG